VSSPSTRADLAKGAVITGAEVVAAHDGSAELLVRLVYENGAEGVACLDADVGFALMDTCGVGDLAGLEGRSWKEMIRGLSPTCTTS
jgi:hypothetical protein